MPAAVQRAAWWWALATAVILPLLAAAAIALAGPAPVRPGAADGLPRDADSTLATALRAQLPEAPGSAATVLFSTDGAPLGPAAVAALTAKAAVLAPLGGAPAPTAGPASGPGTAGPTPTPAPPGLVVSVDRTAAVATVAVAASDASGQAEAVRRLRAEARTGLPPGVNAQVTGPAGITADLAAVFDGANTTLLAATAAVVAVLLMLTYRSPLLWVLPLAVVGLADQLAATVATRVLRATGQAWDESTVGILSVLVFGAGTDYALLLISRYRDELRGTADRFAAMRQAVRHTVEPVLASAGTVVGALLALLLSLFPTTRGLGLACAVGVVIAAAAVLLLLPAVLVLPGRWVFWPRVPHLGEPALVDGRSPWRRVGEAVARRPRVYAAGAVLLLAALAGGTLRVETGLPQAEQFLRKPEAVAAVERLARSFPAGSADPTVVVTTADRVAVGAAARAVPGVAEVRPGRQAGAVGELRVVLGAAPGSAAARQAIRDLRAALAPYPGTHVGGTEAEAVDAAAASARDRQVVFPVVLAVVLAALVALLRCLVAPVLLVATVVATYVAAMGAAWWVFTGPLGFTALADGTPLFAFVFLVGLGVDYNIFLISRVRQEARGHGDREGVLRGLTATGGVITSAGVLLAAVFAVLGVLPLVVLAQLGVVICLGVLLDTLVVRTVLVPALALRLGPRFWWPRRTAV